MSTLTELEALRQKCVDCEHHWDHPTPEMDFDALRYSWQWADSALLEAARTTNFGDLAAEMERLRGERLLLAKAIHGSSMSMSAAEIADASRLAAKILLQQAVIDGTYSE